jgi:hypothetical protein
MPHDLRGAAAANRHVQESAPFPLREAARRPYLPSDLRSARTADHFCLQAGRADRVERVLGRQIFAARMDGKLDRPLVALARDEQTRRNGGNSEQTDTQGADRYLLAVR